MRNYAKHVSTKSTPQSEKIPGSAQQQNNAGGFSFVLDDWKRLDRFLILGSEGGTYYVGERELTQMNSEVIERLLALDGKRVVARIVEVSDKNIAPKNDPAIFALAVCLKKGDLDTRRAAKEAVSKVCRIGTHIFQLAENLKHLGGWGRVTTSSIAGWYENQTPDRLASNVIKYRNRASWTHKDLLRKVHASSDNEKLQAIFRWVTRDGDLAERKVERKKKVGAQFETFKTHEYRSLVGVELPKVIEGFVKVQKATDPREVVKLIREYDLPREALPTQFLDDVKVWETLLMHGKGMPFTAMIRNLGKMTSIGLVSPLSAVEKYVVERLKDSEGLKKARVHPFAILLAHAVYSQGAGFRGGLSWKPSQRVGDALNDAFYEAFQNVVPSGKRHYLALDVSGSMGSPILNSALSCRDGSAAMALITMRTEPWHFVAGFTSSSGGYFSREAGITELGISPKMRLDQVVKKISGLNFGGTDCALPIVDAMKRKMEVDTFVVYTDSETWAGSIHPVQALKEYRQKTGIPAKLIVVGMASNEFTIADPNDSGMLDVVGFDASAPAVMADFSRD
jgi:60 kDa SS-A/Ro ribonucleoprotein